MQAFLLRLFGMALMLSALAATVSHAPERTVESLIARWAPPPSEFMMLKGQLLHYRDVGPRNDPMPLVLLHGTAASLHTWEGWAEALQTRKRVLTFDLPGSGLTGPFTGAYEDQDYRADTLARFTLDVLEALRIDHVAIGGNAFGGEVAWRLAVLAPQRVRQLILVDSTGYRPPPEEIPWGAPLASIPVLNRLSEILTPRAAVARGLRRAYGDSSHVSGALADRYFELLLREGNRHAFNQRLRQASSDFASERIKTIQAPTLILWGERDTLSPLSQAHDFSRDIAGSRLVVLHQLGHLPQEENASQSIVPVLQFLALNGAPL